MQFRGSKPNPEMRGGGELNGRVNYFYGRDPENWTTGRSLYQRVEYQNVYPGVEVVFYGNPQELEFDFVVQPGADPGQIRIGFDRPFRPGPNGSLVFETDSGRIELPLPVAYQEWGGVRQSVPVGYLHRGPGEVGLEVGTYDPQNVLVVDPLLLYSSFLGGAQSDSPTAIALDGEGNIYLVGWTEAGDFPATGGVQTGSAGGIDAFVTKLNPDATQIVYSTYLGGTLADQALDLAVAADGSVVLTGLTASLDFPLVNPLQAAHGGGSDAFVARIAPSGSALDYSTFLGGLRDDVSNGVGLDESGSIYLSGTTRSGDFPVVQAFQEEFGEGGRDAFVARIEASGASLLFSTFVGGDREDGASGIDVDGDGNSYVVGSTRSENFPTLGPIQGALAGSNDAFAVKLNTDGAVVYSTFLGGMRSDQALSVVSDDVGRVLITGDTDSADFPIVDAVQSRRGGGIDVFVAALNPEGTALDYSTYLGGSGNDSGQSLTVDGQGNAYITGGTSSIDFPMLGPLQEGGALAQAFVTKLDQSGAILRYSALLGGGGNEIGSGIAVDGSGNAYVVGSVDRAGFPAVNALQPSFGGKSFFSTVNGGGDWNHLGDGLTDPNVQVLALDPVDAAKIYAGTLDGIFTSRDGGISWESLGLKAQSITLLVVDPVDSETIYAGSAFSILKTSDGGLEWNLATTNLPPFTTFTSLVIDPGDPAVLYLGTDGRGVFKTTDAAETWRAINNGLEGTAQRIFSFAIDPQDSRRLFIGTQGAVYLSRNGGSIWEITSLEGVFAVVALVVDPVSADTIYAAAPASFGNLFVTTTDGGTSWAQSNGGLANLRVNTLILDPSTPSRLFVGTESGLDGVLAKIAPETVFYFPQIGDGANTDDRVLFQTTLILVNSGEATSSLVEFFDSSGDPLQLTLEGLGRGAVFPIPLSRGQSISARTSGEGELKVGYARVTTTDQVSGTAVFAATDTRFDTILFEAGVPAVAGLFEFSVFVDSLEDRDTGLALVYAATENIDPAGEANLTLTLFDRDTNVIGTSEMKLTRGQHTARFIRELFPEIAEQVGEMQGILKVSSDQPVAAVTLRQDKDFLPPFPTVVPTLTAFPVVRSGNARQATFFPQIGDGTFSNSRFQTTLLFVNTGFVGASAQVEFFAPDGQPLNLTLGGLGTGSGFQFAVAPNRFFLAQTPAEDPIEVGYAKITTSSGTLGGTAIFAQTDTESGLLLYEAGVPASDPHKEFSLFVDTLGVRDTGLAMVNVAEEEATITLRLHDKQFALLAENTVSLPGGGHLAQFAWQFFPEIEAQAREMEGLLTVQSTMPLAAVTLRQNDDPTKIFPQDVPTLTAFPVIAGRP